MDIKQNIDKLLKQMEREVFYVTLKTIGLLIVSLGILVTITVLTKAPQIAAFVSSAATTMLIISKFTKPKLLELEKKYISLVQKELSEEQRKRYENNA